MDCQLASLERQVRLDPQDPVLAYRYRAVLERCNCGSRERKKVKMCIAEVLDLAVNSIDEMWSIERLLKASLKDMNEENNFHGINDFRESEMLYLALVLELEEAFDVELPENLKTVSSIIEFILDERSKS